MEPTSYLLVTNSALTTRQFHCAARRALKLVGAGWYVRGVDLEAFAAAHPLRPFNQPKPEAADAEDAYLKLEQADGVLLMPCVEQMEVAPDATGDDGRHLWLIRETDVAVRPEPAPELSLGKAKHTNLSGGGLARCGGEVWRVQEDSGAVNVLCVNGYSGRYTPRDEHELADAVSVFETYHTPTVSAGWDRDTDYPARYFRVG